MQQSSKDGVRHAFPLMPVQEAALAKGARPLMVSQHSCESFEILVRRNLLPFRRMRQQVLAETLHISENSDAFEGAASISR